MKNKNVSVITGGAGGFGRGAAIELGKKGILLLGDFNSEALAKAKAELEVLNIEVYTMKMDVRDQKSCEEFAAYATKLGNVKVVVNIAGVCPMLSYTDAPISSPELTYTTNSIGTMYITDAFFNVMSEGGVLINFASMAGHLFPLDSNKIDVFDSCYEEDFLNRLMELSLIEGAPEYNLSSAAYCTSKAFVLHYTKKNTKRFAEKGCRIFSISPGAHYTKHIEILPDEIRTRTLNAQAILRWGKTWEMGEIIGFLCNDSSGFMTGTDILVDGGAVSISSTKQL
ncbi:MAG: hypothetical protein PWP56_1807 [Acetobacterium sp.]|nr:hypothetical protein [Acetobacterium sp.]